MNVTITWNDKELLYGLDALKDDVAKALSGSSQRLNEDGKKAWRKAMVTDAVLSKGRNGKEWFSFNKKKWFITNQWKTPDVVWAGRNFVKNKRQQASSEMARALGQRKQEELDKALEKAFSNFK
jgi:hypothetical protein